MQCGADICPVYHLGQSQILSFWGPDDFIRRSRMLVGFMWGRWYLPIPRQHDIVSVGGHPIKGRALGSPPAAPHPFHTVAPEPSASYKTTVAEGL